MNRLILQMFPIVVGEVRRSQFCVLGYVRFRSAGVNCVLLRFRRLTSGRTVESGNIDTGHGNVGRSMVRGDQPHPNRLSRDHHAVVGQCIESHVMRRQNGILIVALLDVQAEIDLVPRQIAESHGRKLRAKHSHGGETGLDRSGRGVVIPSGKQILGKLGLTEDRRQSSS